MQSDLCRRAEDLINAVYQGGSPAFLGFLSEEQCGEVIAFLNRRARYSVFGGYTDASRTMICFLPDWAEETDVEFPFSAITVLYRKADKLTHRDFLGTLMSLGIKRETVGDILIESGRAVIFLKNDIVQFVLSQLTKVGGCGVSLLKGYTLPLPHSREKKQITCTVSSLRADNVIAALCDTSRSRAAEYFADKCVLINSACCEKPTQIIKNGDKISVRSKGKFEIISADELSKKGRIILKAEKYV